MAQLLDAVTIPLNNNKLYLHDYNNILQYCKSNLNLTINYLIN